MTGIVGIQGKGESSLAEEMLSIIRYRGKNQVIIQLTNDITLGITSNSDIIKPEELQMAHLLSLSSLNDTTSVAFYGNNVSLKRDKYGVTPLYYVILENDRIAFASEVKALLGFNRKINELEPGYILENTELKKYYELIKATPSDSSMRILCNNLRETILQSIKKRITNKKTGVWLSGGLDSSVISALAKPLVNELHTFTIGFPSAPDLTYARMVADHIKSIHHEKLISFEDILNALPMVIYHLESFDALIVRSSIVNFLVAQLTSEYVEEVFSGEGGDELFAGYEYIKSIPFNKVETELIEITQRMHNTALQRVDRCSSAFATTAHVPFLDEDMVELAIRMPVECKLYNGVGKWILRQAAIDDLPGEVLNRTKSKFWEGSGIREHFYIYAEGLITDIDFQKERNIRCGWQLKSKEELMYYRIFKEHFGELSNLDWMGRTKNVATDRIPNID